MHVPYLRLPGDVCCRGLLVCDHCRSNCAVFPYVNGDSDTGTKEIDRLRLVVAVMEMTIELRPALGVHADLMYAAVMSARG